MLTLNEALKYAGLKQRTDEAATGGQSQDHAPRTDGSRKLSAVRFITHLKDQDKDWFKKFDNDEKKLAKHLLADYKREKTGGQNDSIEDTEKAVAAAIKQLNGNK